MRTPDNNFFKHPIVNPRFFNKNYPEFTNYLNETYKDLSSISEKIYWWKHKLTEKPKCPECGQELGFIGISKGYKQFCSVKCARKSEVQKEKIKQTCLEKYGVANAMQNNDIKNKAKQTCLEKYGVDNPSKSQQIIEKINSKCLETYGVKWPGQIPEVQEKIKQTCLEKYGVNSNIELPHVKLHRKLANIKKMTERYAEIQDIDETMYICKCPHLGCNKCQSKTYKIPTQTFFDRRRDKTEPCTNLLPISKHPKYSGIEIQVQLILDKLGIKYDTQRNDILNGLQLDIYIPDKNIAIEVNGCYMHSIWHHGKYFSPKRQYEKYRICKDKNIYLISIWEDWVKNKPEVVESILRTKLDLCDNVVYARKCHTKPISTKIAKDFIDKNHIQNYARSSFKYGLYHDNELVAVMTFVKETSHQGAKGSHRWSLNRFCSKLNTRVVGGASKLLCKFLKDCQPSELITYSSNDISNGNLYKQLGFTIESADQTEYWYIKPGTLQRWHRTYFNKPMQLKIGLRGENDPRTEQQCMIDHNYMICYDTGITTWTLKLKQ